MDKVLKIFDYFKLAFSVNVNNRKLYKPQIALIILKTCFYVIGGLFLYRFFLAVDRLGFSEELLWGTFLKMFGLTLVSVFTYLLLSIVVESGLYNMYKSCVNQGAIQEGDFQTGVKKYFWRFLLVDVLMIVFWILAVIPYLIVGVVTLFAGFVLVPVLIQIFTSMWKVSMVMEDVKVIDGLKRAFKFANINFLPLSVLIIIRNSFSSISKGSGGKGGSSSSNPSTNFNNWDSVPEDIGNDIATSFDTSFYQWYDKAFPFVKAGFIILIPVISIAVLISSLIKMVFQIFFSLSLFIMYHEITNHELQNDSKEVL